MKPWWIIKYFNRPNGYNNKFDSDMVPFKLLPELKRIDIKKGHEFKTDQFEIRIPESNIFLHMPSKSIWIDNKPYPVKNAIKVLLFSRTYSCNDNTKWKEICIGLLDKLGHGILVKYRTNDNTHTINLIEGNMSNTKITLQDQPKLPDFENK